MSLIEFADRSAKSLGFGLGAGLIGARGPGDPALSSGPPSRGAPQKPAEKPAGKADDAPARSRRKNKPATSKVERGPFKIELVLTGIFAVAANDRSLDQAAGVGDAVQVERAIELGRPVKKGDILVELSATRSTR